MHQFTGVAGVSLQQHGLLMAATADPGAVGEFALGAVVQGIDLHITGQRLAEHGVMGRHITLLRAGDGEHQAFMARQQRFLNRRQYLIGVAVETGLVFGRAGVGDRLVTAIKQVIEADPALIDIRFKACSNLTRPFAGQVINPLVIVIQPDFGQAFADGLDRKSVV